MDPASETGDLIMYTTSWCGYCRVLKRGLLERGVAFTEVDIEAVPDSADFVMGINGGDRTVPTLLFPDGSTMTNPPLPAVVARLEGIAS